MKSMKIFSLITLFVSAAILFVSCNEEDPFVDRVESPVLIVFDGVTGYLAGGGLTYSPSVTKTVTAANYTDPVTLTLTLYELDKSGILDHTVGIDSIPLVDMPLTFSKRDGTLATPLVSNDEGKVVMTTSWEALGITNVADIVNAAEAKSITIPLTWVGSHKGISFAKFSQVVFSKPKS